MFFRRRTLPAAPVPDTIDGVRVRPSTRARRMALRVDARLGDVVLTLPPGASLKKAAVFITEHQDWIEKQRREFVSSVAASHGMSVTVLGKTYTVVHRAGRGLAHIDGDTIIIRGAVEHLPRRLKDFLKTVAESALTDLSTKKLEALGLPPRAISIRDPKTRWGSCAPTGKMMFSWRLILAPPSVMDYVVAHEVAHRVHLNHGRKFWALCAALTENAAESRRWLRRNGAGLMNMI